MPALCEICAAPVSHPRAKTCSDACRKAFKGRYDAEYRRRPAPARPKVQRRAKSCPKCCRHGKVLPASAFGRHRRRVDGLQSYCKACRKAYAQRPSQQRHASAYKKQWHARHREDHVRKMRWRYWNLPGYRERQIAANRARYFGNHSQELARRRAAYHAKQELKRTGTARLCACGVEFYVARPTSPQWFCRPACRQQAAQQVAARLGSVLSAHRRNS